MNPPEGKKFYGSVTIGERGQIVIPAEARKDFNLNPGEKLLVFGDLNMGIWIATFGILQKNMAGAAEFFRNLDPGGEKNQPQLSPQNKTDSEVSK